MNLGIGRLSDFGKPDDLHWQNIREAQVSIASADMQAGWIDCDDLNDKKKDGIKRNDLHYTQQGYEILGRRFVRQARSIIDGKKPAGDGRPH